MTQEKQVVFTTETGVELTIIPIKNRNAIQSLLSDAGVFDRGTGKLSYKKDLPAMVKDWNRLFAYVVMNGVASEPGAGDLEELHALGMGGITPNVLRLNWVRYGKADGVDILTTEAGAAKLVMAILDASFKKEAQAAKQQTDEDEEE